MAELTVTATIKLPEMVNNNNRQQMEALADQLLTDQGLMLAEGQQWIYDLTRHAMEAQVIARWSKSPVAGEQAAVERQ